LMGNPIWSTTKFKIAPSNVAVYGGDLFVCGLHNDPSLGRSSTIAKFNLAGGFTNQRSFNFDSTLISSRIAINAAGNAAVLAMSADKFRLLYFPDIALAACDQRQAPGTLLTTNLPVFNPSSLTPSTISYSTTSATIGITPMLLPTEQICNSGTSAVSENEYGDVKIFPNPFRDKLFVYLPEDLTKNAQLTISDVQGRQVLSALHGKYAEGRLEFETGKLVPGIYFIRLSTINGTNFFRLIREN
jgi:hypothetical protein